MAQLGGDEGDFDDTTRARISELKNIFAPLIDLDLEGRIVMPVHIHRPNAHGSSCDVFKSTLVSSDKQPTIVAVKKFRFFLLDDISFARSLQREVHLWAKLDHPNVLPLVGYVLEGPRANPSLVSKWMVKGTLTEYTKDRPDDADELRDMVSGIASGLHYIHSEHSMVHADLKGSNILVSDDCQPLLADFGLSFSSSAPNLAASTLHGQKGTYRWMAKELLLPPTSNSPQPQKHTKMTDMWAFGMVIYELLSKSVPYERIQSDLGVSLAILGGSLPDKPQFPDSSIFRGIWAITCQCWDGKPTQRPSASDVLDKLKGLQHAMTPLRNSSHEHNPLGSVLDTIKSFRCLHSSATIKADPCKTFNCSIIPQRLSPSFGNIEALARSVATLDMELKLMIAATMHELNKIPNNERTWDKTISVFMQNSLLEPMEPSTSGPFGRSDVLRKEGQRLFINAEEHDDKIAQEVLSWIEQLISDEDVVSCVAGGAFDDNTDYNYMYSIQLRSTTMDLRMLADVVSTNGVGFNIFRTLFRKAKLQKECLAEIGVLRVPSVECPFIKVYRVQLAVQSSNHRGLSRNKFNNSIEAQYNEQLFRPRCGILDELQGELKRKAMAALGDLFLDS